MLFYTLGQSLAFLFMAGCGLLAGVWYDLISLAKRLFRAGRFTAVLLEGVFGAGMAGLVILSLLRALNGELRLYALLGVLSGFAIWRFTVSPLMALLGRKAAAVLRRLGIGLSGMPFVGRALR